MCEEERKPATTSRNWREIRSRNRTRYDRGSTTYIPIPRMLLERQLAKKAQRERSPVRVFFRYVGFFLVAILLLSVSTILVEILKVREEVSNELPPYILQYSLDPSLKEPTRSGLEVTTQKSD
jgi:hypothetical protein